MSDLRNAHTRSFRSVADEVWRPDSAFCLECRQVWPCDAIRLLDQLDQIPEEFRFWFSGQDVFSERFGLPRFDVRHRVVEVVAILGGSEPYVVKGEWREFKTHKGARDLADKWAAEGKTVIIQHAPLVWLTNEEMPQAATPRFSSLPGATEVNPAGATDARPLDEAKRDRP